MDVGDRRTRPSRVFNFGQSSSSIWTSTPSGRRDSGFGLALLQMKTPELPPGSMCIHSMCSRKFSYCFSLRMTPIGRPEEIRMPSFTVQVSSAVLTLTHP